MKKSPGMMKGPTLLIAASIAGPEDNEGECQTAEAKAEGIIAKELRRLDWASADLKLRTKSDPAKLQMASRLRAETTL